MQHILSQLISKRTELKGELTYLTNKIKELENIIHSLDVSIKVFKPDFNLEQLKDKRFQNNKSNYFKIGEANRLILDVFRKLETPLTTREVTIEVMKLKQLPYDDLKVCEVVENSLRATLRQQKKNNIIELKQHEGKGNIWQLCHT